MGVRELVADLDQIEGIGDLLELFGNQPERMSPVAAIDKHQRAVWPAVESQAH